MLADVTFDVNTRRDRRTEGTVRVWQDHDSPGDCRPRIIRAGHDRGGPRDAGARPGAGPVVRQLRRKVGMVFQFHCLFEHLPALKNVWLAPGPGAGGRARGSRAEGARSSADAGRRAPGGRVAARALGGRGAAGGDRAGAGPRSAGAAHGRADLVARPRAARRAGGPPAPARQPRPHAPCRHPRRGFRAGNCDARAASACEH